MTPDVFRKTQERMAIQFGKQETLLTMSRRMKRRVETTCCSNCRESLKQKRRRIDTKLDKLNAHLHELVRQLNKK